MSFKSNLFSVLTVAAGTVIFAGAALAQDTTTAAATPATPEKAERHFKGDREGGQFGHGKHHGGFGEGRGMGGMFHNLNLTDAQKEQMKQIREANKPSGENFEVMRSIMKAKHDGTITPEQEAQLKSFREDRMAKMKSVREQMLNVLTADQKAQLEKNKAEMKAKREEFRKNRELRHQQRQDGAVPAKPVIN